MPQASIISHTNPLAKGQLNGFKWFWLAAGGEWKNRLLRAGDEKGRSSRV